jgi:hypothetical protein
MTNSLLFFFLAVSLIAVGFVGYRWGLKPAVAALASFGALGFALFRSKATPAVTPPPAPPVGAGTAVAQEATAVVTEAATTERAVIAKAAEDPDTLAATMRNQR